MNDHEQKQQARIERLRAKAERLDAAAQSAHAAASRIGDMIPMGQPILVGHHSEGRHRRDLARIDRAMRTSVEASREADRLRSRADRAESSGVVSSDDPEAVSKLKAKLAEAQGAHDRLLEANRRLRAGASDEDVTAMLGWPAGRLSIWRSLGHKTIPTTNSSAELRRLSARVAALEAKAFAPAPAPLERSDGLRIEESDNRVRILFPDKPDEATRAALKAGGFRWSPSAGAWQRQATPSAWADAKRIVGA